MRWYSAIVFPRLCDFILDRPFLARYRRELLKSASGMILEIGFGTGLNLPHYPPEARRITTVDPNMGMLRRARKRMRESGIELEHRGHSGERLFFQDNLFDCVVSTFTLCSIEQVDKALSEVYRVLKPGGRFLFLEHGLSPKPRVQRWQRRLNWLQMRFAEGCHLDRNIRELIAAQPFASVTMEEFYLEKTPSTHGYMYQGVATR
jgi:ubiquinone/menaquinone biosynthesis C-methylase UbiE